MPYTWTTKRDDIVQLEFLHKDALGKKSKAYIDDATALTVCSDDGYSDGADELQEFDDELLSSSSPILLRVFLAFLPLIFASAASSLASYLHPQSCVYYQDGSLLIDTCLEDINQ